MEGIDILFDILFLFISKHLYKITDIVSIDHILF